MAKYTKRPDGRYYARIYIGQENGKKKYKHLYANSAKELEKLYLEAKNKFNKGIDILSLDDTLDDWVNRYTNARQYDIDDTALTVEKFRLKYFTDVLGQYKLKDITQADIQPLIKKLANKNPTTGKPTAKKTLRYYLFTLSQVFDYAMGARVTDYNPCNYVKIPANAPKHERRSLELFEVNRIIEFEHYFKPAVMIMLFAGLRRGECGALTWNDIDLYNHTILVNKAFNLNTMQLKSPKTNAGTRLVTIPQILVNYLNTIPRDSMYVVHLNGQPLHTYQWEYHWKKYLDAMDKTYGVPVLSEKTKRYIDKSLMSIQTFTPHELRHTYATFLYCAGVDVLSAQRLLGHKNADTTLKIYTHLDAIKKKISIESFDKLFEVGVSEGVSESS